MTTTINTQFEHMDWNCMTNGQAPNWSEYDEFEMKPVCEFIDSRGDTFIEPYEGGNPRDPAIVAWTVYGHIKAESVGGIYALHDCQSQNEAQRLLEYCQQQVQ